MAENREQGTGKHPHKSTEEPYPHHEAKSTQHGSHEGSSHYRQHEQSNEGGVRQQSASGSESNDLKGREYRDEQGNVHHHTRTYEEQHKGEK